MNLFLCVLFTTCNREIQPFFVVVIGYSLGGGGGGNILGSGLNLTVPFGSGRVRRSWVRAGFSV